MSSKRDTCLALMSSKVATSIVADISPGRFAVPTHTHAHTHTHTHCQHNGTERCPAEKVAYQSLPSTAWWRCGILAPAETAQPRGKEEQSSQGTRP
jgi:hypothetical protein